MSGVDDFRGCHLSYRLRRAQDEPIVGSPFIVEIGWGRVLRGTTDGEGGFEYGDVAPGDYLLQIEGVMMHLPALPKDCRWQPLIVRPDR